MRNNSKRHECDVVPGPGGQHWIECVCRYTEGPFDTDREAGDAARDHETANNAVS